MELAVDCLAAGRSAIILTPEISLTSQLSASFRAVFGDRVLVLHSQLTPAQHRRAWLQALRNNDTTSDGKEKKLVTSKQELGRSVVVIGARSALFTPLANVGLIVIDEAHETSYKQEQAPYYHSLRVAAKLAELHRAKLLIGSATPSVNDYFMAEQRHKPILRMRQLAKPGQGQDTSYSIVDIKDRSQFVRSQYLSTTLLQALQAAGNRGEQSLVYLNRRGTARLVLCEVCSWQALCPHCDLPLVYHADTSRFQCHTCGHHQPITTTCPSCGNPSLSFKSFGTKALLSELERLLPEARIQRFDTDNPASERFERHYQSIHDGEVDILVGTQLLAKGIDLPKLTTLGIVMADSSLSLPDFSAQERTFQLLTQVLGRIGRGHSAGAAQAVIQTYRPESPLLRAAISDDWESFYKAELAERRNYRFPPFYHLLKLSCRRASAKSAEAAAKKLKLMLSEKLPNLIIDGPAPSFHERIQGKYQYQLVVKSTKRSQLLSVIDLLPSSGWSYDIDPINLL
jgi:primosomal protein N' (replication factor Y)